MVNMIITGTHGVIGQRVIGQSVSGYGFVGAPTSTRLTDTGALGGVHLLAGREPKALAASTALQPFVIPVLEHLVVVG